jgi:hypothetical protein
MRKSQLGSRSTFGSSRTSVRSVTAPWGSPIPKRGGSRGSRPRGSSTAKPTPDPSLWSMRYKPNDPLAWPLENPQERSDLNVVSGHTQAKVDFNNAAVNHAFERAGYDG